MSHDTESAMQYAHKHGLFCSHRHGRFLPYSCIAHVQTTATGEPAGLLHEAAIFQFTDKAASAITYDQEDVVQAVTTPDGATQANTHAVCNATPNQGLLLEIPDLGTGLQHYRDSVAAKRYPRLSVERLPLLPVDVSNDEGLEFPPHMDRLHQALILKVDNEKTEVIACNSTSSQNADHITQSEIFPVHNRPLTPPPSPACGTGGPGAAVANAPAIDVVKAAVTSPTGSKPGSETDHAVEVTRQEQSEIQSTSFFEDAIFEDPGGTGAEDDDAEMQDVNRILDQIESILVPLPKSQEMGASEVTQRREKYNWTSQMASFAPIPVNPASEAALLWVPFPPGPSKKFDDETVHVEEAIGVEVKPRENPRTYTVTISERFKDGEVEECAEPVPPTPPTTAPASSALSSLIKLRQQENGTKATLGSKLQKTGLGPGPNRPILSSSDDPGATSNLVSAFMSLRRPKKAQQPTH